METIYGTSLGLDIPKLKCKKIDTAVADDEVECERYDAFAREKRNPSTLVDINQYILDIINASVDFFIQYHSISDDGHGHGDGDINSLLRILLELKKIIFSFTGSEFTLLFDTFTKTMKQRYFDSIPPDFDVVSNMGRLNMIVENIKPLKTRQKLTNLYLLVLSYKILSMSGILGINILDIEDIIKNEKDRKNEQREQSFILHFLPKDLELVCFQDVEFFFLREMNAVIFQKINALVPPSSYGGSKCIIKKHNKSIKNKHKCKNKYNFKNTYKRNLNRNRRHKSYKKYK